MSPIAGRLDTWQSSGMVERKRQRLLTVRVNDAEMQMARELADAEGLGMSDYVRNLIRAEHALSFGRKRAAKKSATKKKVRR